MNTVARPAILRVDDLRVVFRSHRSSVTAVNGVSLHIDPGATIGIVGESGSGKSTLARALLGLLPGGVAPIEGGRFWADGKEIYAEDLASLRGHTAAMVFQDPLSYLNPIMTAGKQIGESVRKHDAKAPLQQRIEELLDLVRLPKRVYASYPHELSGGMRQRVLLAIALGCRPKMLIADEPTTALDVTTQAEILALIKDVRAQLGMALLLISHDLGVVSTMCDHVNIMYRGVFVEQGPAERIFNAPQHAYTERLMKADLALRDERGRFITMEDEPGARRAGS